MGEIAKLYGGDRDFKVYIKTKKKFEVVPILRIDGLWDMIEPKNDTSPYEKKGMTVTAYYSKRYQKI